MLYFPSASVFACGKSCPCPPKPAGRSATVTSARPLPCAVTVPEMTPPDLPAALGVGDCARAACAQKERARKSATRRAVLVETSDARFMATSTTGLIRYESERRLHAGRAGAGVRGDVRPS